MKPGGISIHAVNIATGETAKGLRVTLNRLAPDRREIASGEIGANGLLDHPVARGQDVVAGTYEVLFDLGDYFQARGVLEPFLDIAPFRFVLRDPASHVHLPFKFTPFGFSLFRGA